LSQLVFETETTQASNIKKPLNTDPSADVELQKEAVGGAQATYHEVNPSNTVQIGLEYISANWLLFTSLFWQEMPCPCVPSQFQ
jgi:hypothetical protein